MRVIKHFDKYIRKDGAEVSEEVWEYLKLSVCPLMRYDLLKNGINDGGARNIYFAHCLDYLKVIENR